MAEDKPITEQDALDSFRTDGVAAQMDLIQTERGALILLDEFAFWARKNNLKAASLIGYFLESLEEYDRLADRFVKNMNDHWDHGPANPWGPVREKGEG